MYQVLEREAARAGLPLNWPPRLPDTRTALSAAEWVRRERPGASDEFNQALFAAHFELGEDLGDSEVIMRHAAETGIDAEALRAALADSSAGAFLAEAKAVGVLPRHLPDQRREPGVDGRSSFLGDRSIISGPAAGASAAAHLGGSAMALHTAATAPTRRLHSRRLAWTERAGIPARAGRILANDHGAWEMSR